MYVVFVFFFFQAEDGIRDYKVTGVQTCALPIWRVCQTEAKFDERAAFAHRTCPGGRGLWKRCPLHHPAADQQGESPACHETKRDATFAEHVYEGDDGNGLADCRKNCD